MTADVLEAQNLCCAYGSKEILRNVSFKVDKGALCGLLGPNGSGKTTLFRCLLKFQKNWSGSVSICGKNTEKLNPGAMAALVSYVPQDHHATFPFTVREMVRMGRTPLLSSSFKLSLDDLEAVEKSLELLGIKKIADQTWNSLSGGQRQLALIARAVVQKAPLMLLDEPTSALDFKNQIEVWQVLRKLADLGFTIIACCHDPNYILWYCNQVILLKDGLVTGYGKPQKMLTQSNLNKLYGDACQREHLLSGLDIVHPLIEKI